MTLPAPSHTITRVTTRVTAASHTTQAGARSVQYVVIADTVTVDGVAVPANVAITHHIHGAVVDPVAFDATAGDVLVIEEVNA